MQPGQIMKRILPEITHGKFKSNFEYFYGSCKQNTLLEAADSDNVYSTPDTLQNIYCAEPYLKHRVNEFLQNPVSTPILKREGKTSKKTVTPDRSKY